MKDSNRLNDMLKPEFDAPVRVTFQDDGTGWDLCGTPILCIYKGDMPTKTLQDVVIHNFLPNSVIGFAVTEKCNVINPVVECEPGPPTTEAECDALVGRHLCPGCEVMEGKCPDICCDPPDVDNEGMPAPVDPIKVAESLSDYVDGLGTCSDRDIDCPVAETLYRTGVWVSLQNRLHDLMSEWSMAAAECPDQDDDCGCTQFGSDVSCHYDNCPRIRAKA
jgi:hypothetical protein